MKSGYLLILLIILPSLIGAPTMTSASAGPLIKSISNKLAPKTPAPPPLPIHEKWALVIGISDFQDPAIKPMRLAEKSAASLSKTLTDPNAGRFAADHLLLLTGSKATHSAIEDAFIYTYLARKALPHDLVLIYICSRLIPSPDGKELYLCAYDTLASEAERSAIPLKEVLTELRHRLQSKFIFCLLDTADTGACPGKVLSLAKVTEEAGVSIFSATSPGQTTDRSGFTAAVCECLQSAAGMFPLEAVAKQIEQKLAGTASYQSGMKDAAPALYVAADGQELLSLPAGVPVKSSIPPRKLSIGHPVDNLMANRPDLAGPRTRGLGSRAEEEEEDNDTPGNVNFGSYMAKMKQDIQKRWQPPKGLENRRVVTTFVITRVGEIVSPQVVETSGVAAADNAALEALKAASPLDPLPAGAPQSVQIRYQFDWRVSHH